MSLGKRKRAEVNYKEQVSDSQYFKMIEAGLDPNNENDVKRARKQQSSGTQAASTQQDEAQVSPSSPRTSNINKDISEVQDKNAGDQADANNGI